MQISTNNSVNFTSTPLHYVNLRKVTNGAEDGFVRAVFTKLNPKDLEGDCLAVDKIKDTWMGTSLRDNFAGAFKFFKAESNHYNAIELVGNNNLGDRIVGLAKSSVELGRMLKLSLLLIKPEMSRINYKRSINHIGELMLGEMFNKAKQLNVSKLELESAEDDFYIKVLEKAGIELTPEKYDSINHKFHIPVEDFDKYINWCQSEYKTNFSATI